MPYSTTPNIEELQQRIKQLEEENANLRLMLQNAGIPLPSKAYIYTAEPKSQNSLPATKVTPTKSNHSDQEQLARRFFSYFWGREDVYAKRYVNKKTDTPGYSVQCSNLWDPAICPKALNNKYKCSKCDNMVHAKLTPKELVKHLEGKKSDGSDVIGVYPLLPDNTCRFLVFDFDNHLNLNEDWMSEVDAIREICRNLNIPCLIERSRSGHGAHVWFFFKSKIAASKARKFATTLLEKGAEEVSLKTFVYFDRMIPMQDELPEGGIGNLIALPLQGGAVPQGNSCFVDENWNAYPEQWKTLFSTRKIGEAEIDTLLEEWSLPSAKEGNQTNNQSPWDRRKNLHHEDVTGTLEVILANKLYINSANLKPRIQNQLRRMAAVSNPKYFENLSMKYSNFDTPRYIYLGGDEDGFLTLPRGVLAKLKERLSEAHIPYTITDKRQEGRQLRVEFTGVLRPEQVKAAQAMLANETGVLWAAPGFGKTVVGSYLIAQKKCSTLILLENSALIEQWENSLHKFLNLDEPLPTYQTKTGRIKTRKELIGIIKSQKDTSGGLIDIAMAGSLFKDGGLHPRLHDYGMVIVDECHHAASARMSRVLQEVHAKYVYGATATKERRDGLHSVNELLLGPVRFHYSAKEQAEAQDFPHYVVSRFTRVVSPYRLDSKKVNDAYELVRDHEERNQLIVEDVRECIAQGRTPVVLSRYVAHAKFLAEQFEAIADHVFLMVGELGQKRLHDIGEELAATSASESLIIVATGNLIGEGFDFPRLDTMIMATPISWKGIVEQYVGRLNREYPGKKSAVIYDYVDPHIDVLAGMYAKRMKAYKRIGYEVTPPVFPGTAGLSEIQPNHAIYDAETYRSCYQRDLLLAKQEIIVSSPELYRNKVYSFVRDLLPLQTAGVRVVLLTEHPDESLHGKLETRVEMLEALRNAGICVRLTRGNCSRFTVVDHSIVWYGSLNHLGKEDADDIIMRIESSEVANELFEMTFSNGDLEEYGQVIF